MSKPISSDATALAQALRVSKSGIVFSKMELETDSESKRARKTDKEALEEFFRSACAAIPHFEKLAEVIGQRSRRTGGQYSLVVFRTKREPTFLKDSGLVDLFHGFILLVEQGSIAALLSKHAGSPERHLPGTFERLGYQATMALFGGEDAFYESVSLRTLGTGKGGLLRRAYEAADLRQVMPRAGARRSAPTSLKVRRDGTAARLAPGTSRVSQLGPRVDTNGVLDFVRDVVKERSSPQESPFIETFAEPIDVATVPAGVTPASLLIHWGDLEEILGKDLLIDGPKGRRRASRAEFHRLRDMLTTDTIITETDGGAYRVSSEEQQDLAVLKPTKTKFTFTSTVLEKFATVQENEELPLDRLINSQQLFTINFSDPTYAYTSEAVFRNRNLPEELDAFLSCFVVLPNLSKARNEKGTILAGMTGFETKSVFDIVERAMAKPQAIVICDDLGDEWADHIVLDPVTPRIEFIHSKWKTAATTSASAFHDLASQGTKNLGNLMVGDADFRKKCASKWGKTYRGKKVKSNIQRIRSGHSPAQCSSIYAELSGRVDTVAIMSLAASFLSKTELETQAGLLSQWKPKTRQPGAAKKLDSVQPHIVQLIWILASFIDVCRANSVQPRVYCTE